MFKLRSPDLTVPTHTWRNITSIGIQSKRSSTYRGVRAGRRKHRIRVNETYGPQNLENSDNSVEHPIPVLVTYQRQISQIDNKANPANLVTIPPQNKSKLRFSCLNVQSLRNKTSEFHDFVVENMLDVVAVTETWLESSGDEIVIAELTPAGYTFQHIPRVVGLLYKSNLTVKIKRNDEQTFSSFESLHAEISSHSTTRPFHRKTVYLEN